MTDERTDATARAERLAAIEEFSESFRHYATDEDMRWLVAEVRRLEYEIMLANDALASYAMLVDRRDTERARVLELLRTGYFARALDVLEGKGE